jgi:hypothetical protein
MKKLISTQKWSPASNINLGMITVNRSH